MKLRDLTSGSRPVWPLSFVGPAPPLGGSFPSGSSGTITGVTKAASPEGINIEIEHEGRSYRATMGPWDNGPTIDRVVDKLRACVGQSLANLADLEIADGAAPERRQLVAFDPRRADASYRPFPSFREWRANIDFDRWDRAVRSLQQLRRDISTEGSARAFDVVKRAAALDTGAIEGLYEVDRGFTFSVATQAAAWEIGLSEKGPHVAALFESQLKAYERVVDFATQQIPIAEAWIRGLHAEICSAQETYVAWTELGTQAIALPKGEYKHLPNHVLRPDGSIHSYAPVDMTAPEMSRFCEELRCDAFAGAHPALQASYAHYAFVVIHPFADGNGRVARALASVFTCRSESVPLLILADQRKEYFASLTRADSNHYEDFVRFIFERVLDAISLAEEGLRTATVPSVGEAVDRLTKLYADKGGHGLGDVDHAGEELVRMFREELAQLLDRSALGMVVAAAGNVSGAVLNEKKGYRPVAAAGGVYLQLTSAEPARVENWRQYFVEVPRAGGEGDVILRERFGGDEFHASMAELIPVPSSVCRMRVRMKVEAVLAAAMAELAAKVASELQK